MIYQILVHSHSGLRWLLLLVLIITLIRSKSLYTKLKPWALSTLILTHIQLIIGLVLYFVSPKVIFSAESMQNSITRFFLVEHISLMLISVVLITIGYLRFKKRENQGYRKPLLVYYSIALVLILASIPWPFRNLGSGWF